MTASRLHLAIPKGRMYDSVVRLLADAGVELKGGARAYRPVLTLAGFELLLLPAMSACTGDLDSGWEDTESTSLETRDFGDAFDADTLRERVSQLADPSLEGRLAGSEGDAAAVDYLQATMEQAGLEAPQGGWQHAFVDSDSTTSVNLVGVRWGESATVGHEIIVVGAHHDHLGLASNGDVYAGANDDASGMAVLLGLADMFGSGQAPDRTVVLAVFGSEEVNLDGSLAYLDDPPSDLPIEDTVHYVNLDMVGTYGAYEVLYALDASPGTDARRLVQAAAAASPLNVDVSELGELSDSVNFCEAGVPEVFFFTDDPDCYHETCDTADRLDYDDLSEVGELVAVVVDALTSEDEELASVRQDGCVNSRR